MSQFAVAVAIFFIAVCQSFTNSFRIRDLMYDDYGEYNFADKRGDEVVEPGKHFTVILSYY